jgi:hypothetical protein
MKMAVFWVVAPCSLVEDSHLHVTRVFVVFLSTSRRMQEQCLGIGYERVLPNTFKEN